jgi:excisionase family DNA binding protein
MIVSITDQLRSKKRLMTPDEVADLLAISPKTIYARVKAGTIPSFHIGSSIRFDPAKIAQWLEDRAA